MWRWLSMAIVVVALLLGFNTLADMSVGVWPEVPAPLVEVQTESLGLSAAEVEALITVPMEADLLNGVAWLGRITSKSVAGLSSIRLVFEPGTDPIRARQMVAERLTQAFALPNVSKPPTMLPPLSSASRVMMIGLTSREISLIDMSVLARWNIKPRLMGVPGVANVAIWGQRERQLQVQVDPQQLQARGVTLAQVIETAGNALWMSPLSFLNASTPGTAGWIDTPNQRLGLHHILPIREPKDLARVAVVGSEALRLGDVAQVVEDHQPLIGDAGSGDDAGLLLVVEKFPGADTVEVTEDVEEALATLAPGLPGIGIDTTLFRPASYLTRMLNNLALAAGLGAVLVILGLLAFGEEWRVALLAAAVICLAAVAAGLLLSWRGASLDPLTVAAVAAATLGATPSVVGLLESTGWERRRLLVFAAAIGLLVMAPVFFWQGPADVWLAPVAAAYGLALLASAVVALSATPMLGMMLFGKGWRGRGPSAIISWLAVRYREDLARLLPISHWVSWAVVIVGLAGLLALPRLDMSGRTAFQQMDLFVSLQGMPGTAGAEMKRVAAAVSRELRAVPHVRRVGVQVGRAVAGDQVVGMNSGELWISLEPTAEYEKTVADIQKVIDGYPGLARKLTTYPAEENSGRPVVARDVVVRIYGHDFAVLAAQAQKVRGKLANVAGVGTTQAELPSVEPQVEIEVDLASAQRYRIKPGDVRRQAATLLSGIQVGSLFEEQKVFDVVVWGKPEIRNNLSNLGDLLIETPGGAVALKDIARVRIAPSPTIIAREAVSRYVDVVASVHGRSLGSVRREVKSALARATFPLEYHVEVLDGPAGQQNQVLYLLSAAAASGIGIFLLLQAAFGSWRLAAVFLLSLPAAASGGVLTAYLGEGLSPGSLLGLLVTLGVAVVCGLMLIRAWQLARQDSETLGSELILREAQRRFTPVVMTSLAVGLAMLPVGLLGPRAGYEILYPMAQVLLGGLATTTALTLFGLPALYFRWGPRP